MARMHARRKGRSGSSPQIREKNPNINPRDLKRFFVRIEKPYYSRRLSLDAPEPVELEE